MTHEMLSLFSHWGNLRNSSPVILCLFLAACGNKPGFRAEKTTEPEFIRNTVFASYENFSGLRFDALKKNINQTVSFTAKKMN